EYSLGAESTSPSIAWASPCTQSPVREDHDGVPPSPFREILIASLSLPLFVGVIEGWEFPWITPSVSTGPMSESELVREQGGWVFAGSISNSILGFAFWALAAHLFTSSAVGITDGSILAARKSEYLAYRAVAYGLAKIALVFTVAAAGVVGLLGSYTLPLLAITVVSLFLVWRVWPARNENGIPTRLRDLSSLSFGNWIHGFTYSLPSRRGPSIMLIFVGPSPLAYFFIALQLAGVLNYIPESVSKSLFA